MADTLDGEAVRRWCAAALDALEQAREEIDDLNVYPVPDGDTGTNLWLTMRSVADAVHDAEPDLAATTKAVARGALMGARGNSGVILSQMLRGLAETLTGPQAGAEELRCALDRASELSYAAVARPVEGTILSVGRAAAQAARDTPDDDVAAVVSAAARGAAEALARTPDQLEALARAGVVDAGGRGLVVVLDALAATVTGGAGASVPAPVQPGTATRAVRPDSLPAEEDKGSGFAYEVLYLLDAEEPAVRELERRLGGLGDSLVVVGGDGQWRVHVHVDDVGAAIEAGIEAGRPHDIRVTRFDDQIAARSATGRGDRPGTGLVVVLPGQGLVRLFEAEGAVVVGGGPSANPSTAEVLHAIETSPADDVVVLPNDSNIRAVAEAAADLARAAGRRVAVVPTRSPVQAIAALAVHDPGRRFDDDVIAMTAAAGATRFAQLTVAVRESQTSVGVCRPGDVLGMMDGDVAVIGDDLAEVARSLLDRMLIGGGEVVTLVTGQDAPADLGRTLLDYLRATRPALEAGCYDGGQPYYPLLLGVE